MSFLMQSKAIRIRMRSVILTVIAIICVVLLTTHASGKPTQSDPQPKRALTVRERENERKLASTNQHVAYKDVFKPWLQNECRPIKKLLTRKDLAQRKIMQTVTRISNDFKMSQDEKKYQIQAFRILSQELNETETGILNALKWLDSTLKGDLKNFATLQEKSKNRLESLRDAALKEEQEYNEILEAQTGLEKINSSDVKGVLGQIMHDVANAADELELSLNENIFNDAMKDKNMAGSIETVIKLPPDESASNVAKKDTGSKGGLNSTSDEQNEGVVKLVDSKDNQFVLSKGSDTTVPHEDHHLIQDVIYLLFVCLLLGYACHMLTLPTMFGYIIAGVILGPSGFNFLQSLVQLETLGEFGVFFILFAVGLEFSPTEVRKVFKIATIGTLLMALLFILCGIAIGMIVNATLKESIFVSACLSLSSTPLVIKFLSPGSTVPSSSSPGSGATVADSNTGSSPTDYGSILLGILIMQDVFLGLLMAILPNLAGAENDANADSFTVIGLRMVAAMLVAVAMTWMMSKYVIGQLYAYLKLQGSREILVLFTISLAFTVLTITNILGISMELGCFLAGVMVSAQGHHLAEQIENLIQPVKDFLACIFFASIGLHVFPQFLAYQLTFLTSLTMAVVGAKYIISVGVLAVLTHKSKSSSASSPSSHIKWLVAAGLAQVSEFSFVLGSRARRLGLISREVYLLILSITTLSLLFAPVLWKSTLWRLRIKQKKTNIASVASQVLLQSPVLPDIDETSLLLSSDEEDEHSPARMARRISLVPQ